MKEFLSLLVVSLLSTTLFSQECAPSKFGNATCLRTAVATVAQAVLPPYGRAEAIAARSAQYRAANRIQGHTHIESSSSASGVGYSSFDSTPMTCLGEGGPGYSVARGPDGWYATKVQTSNTTSHTSTVVQSQSMQLRKIAPVRRTIGRIAGRLHNLCRR